MNPARTCKCGKTFEKARSYSAHSRHCLAFREGKPPDYSKGSRPSEKKGKRLEDIVKDPAATRKKLSDRLRGVGIPLSPEGEAKRRAKLSLAAIRRLETDSHLEWFEVGGVKVQGGWERRVAERLVELRVEFSRPRLKYGTRHYTPDFYLPDLGLYIEVKGWFRDSDVRKTLLVLQEHDIDLRVILGGKMLDSFTEGRTEIQGLPRFDAKTMAAYPNW